MNQLKPLRPYQAASLDALRDGIRQGKKGQVLALQTGGGKSIIATHLLKGALDKGNRAVFMVDRRVLVDQFSKHLDDSGIDHGVLMSGHGRWRPDKPIQVASIQTLLAMKSWPIADLVIIDEVHSCLWEFVQEHLESGNFITIGLSATPFHKDMGKHFQGVVNVITMRELVDDGYLVPFRVFAAHEIDTSGLRAQGDSWKGVENRALSVVGDVVSDYQDIVWKAFGGDNKKTIVFSSGVQHGKELAQAFGEAGFNFVPISHLDDEDDKYDILQEFAKPDSGIDGVISTDILTRGFDQTDVEHVVLAQPLRKSFSKFVQMIGRGARPHPGKTDCVIQCNSGNWLRFEDQWRHFFNEGVTEIPDGVEKAPKERTEKEKEASKCPSCGYLWAPADDHCKICGCERKRMNNMEVVAGIMREIEEPKKPEYDGPTKERWYQELLKHARGNGMKDGWAYFKYQEKFEVKPNWKKVAASSISPDVQKWIISQNIRYANRRNNNVRD